MHFEYKESSIATALYCLYVYVILLQKAILARSPDLGLDHTLCHHRVGDLHETGNVGTGN